MLYWSNFLNDSIHFFLRELVLKMLQINSAEPNQVLIHCDFPALLRANSAVEELEYTVCLFIMRSQEPVRSRQMPYEIFSTPAIRMQIELLTICFTCTDANQPRMLSCPELFNCREPQKARL